MIVLKQRKAGLVVLHRFLCVLDFVPHFDMVFLVVRVHVVYANSKVFNCIGAFRDCF